MNFIISSSYLFKHLQILGSIASSSNTVPILDNFLFELDNSKLTISVSDLETRMSTTLDVSSQSIGSVAISAKLLLETIKTFPEQPLTFKIEDNNTIEISSDYGKYTLAYSNSDEFPKIVELDNPTSTRIKADALAKAISMTLFAAGNDDLRPVISGVCFQFSKKKLVFAATDAHKLVKYTLRDIAASEVAEFIMPKKPLSVLKGILTGKEELVTIEYNNSNAKFIVENSVLTCRLIEGKFPNYEAVIPRENPNILTINRVQFLNSVRRVSIFSNKTTHQVRLKIAGAELNISTEDNEFHNKAIERLTCEYIGDDLEIGFNSRFLSEILSNLDSENIQLAMSLPNRAGLLTPLDGLEKSEQVTMLVMPVMISNSEDIE